MIIKQYSYFYGKLIKTKENMSENNIPHDRKYA